MAALTLAPVDRAVHSWKSAVGARGLQPDQAGRRRRVGALDYLLEPLMKSFNRAFREC